MTEHLDATAGACGDLLSAVRVRLGSRELALGDVVARAFPEVAPTETPRGASPEALDVRRAANAAHWRRSRRRASIRAFWRAAARVRPSGEGICVWVGAEGVEAAGGSPGEAFRRACAHGLALWRRAAAQGECGPEANARAWLDHVLSGGPVFLGGEGSAVAGLLRALHEASGGASLARLARRLEASGGCVPIGARRMEPHRGGARGDRARRRRRRPPSGGTVKDIQLVYFDIDASRGEECRLALHLAGIPFEDVRIRRPEWGALKPDTPWGSLPLLRVAGQGTLAQSNAILGYIGRAHGLLPADPWEAARHDAILCACEDLRVTFTPALWETDPERRRELREAFVAGPLPQWARGVEGHLGEGPWFGASLGVADIKVFVLTRWFLSGILDHVPTTCLDAFPRLKAHHDAVATHPGVQSWTQRPR